MRRRDFVAVVGGAAAWPLAVRAQQSATRPLIGVLSPISPAAAKRNIEGLREGLRALGYAEGHNVSLELRFAEGVVARLPELASDLVINPDDQTDAIYLKYLPATAHALGVDLAVFKARTVAEIEMVFAAARRDGMQALFVSQSPLFSNNRTQVTALAASVRLPAIYGFREYAEAGGLMSYGV